MVVFVGLLYAHFALNAVAFVSGPPALEAALLPTRFGYALNLGLVPPVDPDTSPESIQVELELRSGLVVRGERSLAIIRVRNGIKARPFAFDGRGHQGWTKIGLVLKRTVGGNVVNADVQPPSYMASLDSATLPIWRLYQGEYVEFPITFMVNASPGEYSLEPYVVSRRSEDTGSAYYNKNDWHGTAEGAAVRVTVKERRSASPLFACFEPAAVRAIPTANIRPDAKGDGLEFTVAFASPNSNAAVAPGSQVSLVLELTAWDEDCLPTYSPVNWHRALGNLDVSLAWLGENEHVPFAVLAVDDPPELAPISALVPIDRLKHGYTIRLPLKVTVPEAPGIYRVRFRTILNDCIPYQNVRGERNHTNDLKVKIVKE